MKELTVKKAELILNLIIRLFNMVILVIGIYLQIKEQHLEAISLYMFLVASYVVFKKEIK